MAKKCSEQGCQTQGRMRRKMCERHYQNWLDHQPRCNAEDCDNVLVPENRETTATYCRPHERLILTDRTEAQQRETLARFRQGIEPDWETGCWMWQEIPNDGGYGQFWIGRRSWFAHRFAYIWFRGGHPPRRTLDHICNRAACCNPRHLWALTNTENNKFRRQRDQADGMEFWKHAAHLNPVSLRTAEWAIANGLP